MNNKKYYVENDFDMLILRHDYLSRLPDLDKYSQDVVDFRHISTITAGKVYAKLKNLFEKVSMDYDDIISLSDIYTMIYMGHYSIKHNPEIKDRVIKNHIELKNKVPTKAFLESYEKNCLIRFLRGKLSDAAKLCDRKSRNIKVGRNATVNVARTKNSIVADDELLVKDYKKYRYRKVSQKELKTCRQINGKTIDSEGFEIRTINIIDNGLSYEEYSEISEKGDAYHLELEEMMIEANDTVELAYNKNSFNGMSDKQKRAILRKFIVDNTDNKLMKENVILARKMLKNIKEYGIIK